ncbi:unnamed protein product [Cylindrotheca closterium]|uniref:Uncharacterized protein n=1 Tax=Cylindrotheca closterium TaxID=2856 RepID=A0AAD2FCU1_9STRA|nr:unnamed protein product [Cylindrotheca closterium]
MIYREAIQLSNQVASLLESKRFYQAILVACTAMEVFQKQTPTAEKASLSGHDFIDPCMAFCCNRDCASDSRSTMDEEYTYEHGIILPLNTIDWTAITAVLIFNCALTHHLAAGHCYDHVTSQHFLKKSLRLYTLAYNEQDRQDQNIMFQAAIVNNVGLIHKRLGSQEEAQACFDFLTTMIVMMRVSSTEGDSCLGEDKYRQHVQDFWKNILGNKRSVAPAA